MKILRIKLCAFVLFAACSSSVAQSISAEQADKAIVDRLFPAELSKTDDPGFTRLNCFQRIDSQTIVAAYSYSLSAAIFLLKADGNGQYRRAFEVSGLDLTGGECHVNRVHLWDSAHSRSEGEHSQQVIIGFSTATANSMEWAFEVVDDKLIDIGPHYPYTGESGDPETVLSQYDLVNYDHDGTMQLVSGGEYPPPADGSGPEKGMDLYRIVDHKFVLDASVDVIFETSTDSSDPSGSHYDFLKPTSLAGPFTLRLINGDWHGEHRVRSATITLNGAVAATLSPVDDIVEVNVPLKEGNNVVAVEANTEGSEQMTLAIIQKVSAPTNVPTTPAQ